MEELFYQHPIASIAVIMFFIAGVMLFIHIVKDGVKCAKFENDCLYLEFFISNGSSDYATFNEALNKYFDLKCTCFEDHKRKDAINKMIKAKYYMFLNQN